MNDLKKILAGLALLATSHAHSASGCTPLPGAVTPNVRWPQVWQQLSTNANCTDNCHSGTVPTAGLNLSSPTISIYFLVNQFSNQVSTVPMVVPGNAKASLFFQKINCTAPDVGNRMPPGGQVSTALQALIYDWIEQGAYGENPEDPIARDFIFRDGAESQRR
jgi:hypothetical protein